ncbi:MAG TPA: hypothetical protein VGW38_11520 [Chloroflexota bacterium]|nr:hypothetical protein [Chloroflexota bacterium]
MYTTQKTELGKLRQYERELTKMYAEAVLRRRFGQAKSLYDRRHTLRRAILQYEEWNVDTGGVLELPRQEAIAEDLARAA